MPTNPVINIVTGIEQSLSQLFTPKERPFVVTNQFLYDLVRSNAKILRAKLPKSTNPNGKNATIELQDEKNF
jgi:hypothetical protein